eukprot:Em0022g578a
MDRVYRSFLSSVKFFSNGWGPVDTYRRLLDSRHVIFDRCQCSRLLESHAHPIRCEKVREIPGGTVYMWRIPLACDHTVPWVPARGV